MGKGDGKKSSEDREVSMGAKVPLSWRRFWVGEARKQGTSLKAVLIEALTERFGRPGEAGHEDARTGHKTSTDALSDLTIDEKLNLILSELAKKGARAK